MSTIPKVSVLIPTYNYARFLDETIQSVLNQTFTNFELTIVDNCSTDNTEEVVKKYLTDKRVSFYRNETNVGLVGNWNKCLEYARGEYIKFLCADDKLHPKQLEKFIAIMEAHPDVSIISSHTEVFGANSFCRISPFNGLVNRHIVRKVLLGRNNKLRNPSVVMFRKKDAEKIGKFNPELIQLVDRDYYIKLLNLGDCYVIPEALAYIRSHPNTQTMFVRDKKYELIFERYRFLKSVKSSITSPSDPNSAEINEHFKNAAVRSAAVIFEVLPKLYKKENINILKSALKIGYVEGVLLAPFSRYLQWNYLSKLLRRNKKATVSLT
jgi:glycosyltransferase involved in cell wall biosynthesis